MKVFIGPSELCFGAYNLSNLDKPVIFSSRMDPLHLGSEHLEESEKIDCTSEEKVITLILV